MVTFFFLYCQFIYLPGTHLGLERTLEPVTDKYYWVGIHRFARDYIRQCPICLDRNPRLGQGGLSVSGASLGESSYDDGSSIGGDDTLSISGTEVVSTAGDADSVYEHCPGFEREIAKSFWEMVGASVICYTFTKQVEFTQVG